MTNDIPDAAAVQAAIERCKQASSPREDDWDLLEDAQLLADACEHYQRELAERLTRITVRCRGCKKTASAIFETQEDAFDFSDQFGDSHAAKCGRWTSHCNYCGHTAQGTKQEAIEQSKTHDLVCEKSPLAEMRLQLAAALARERGLREALEAAKRVISCNAGPDGYDWEIDGRDTGMSAPIIDVINAALAAEPTHPKGT